MSPVERARLRARHWKHRPSIAGNVVPLHPMIDDGFHGSRADTDISVPSISRPFDKFTQELVLAQYRAGTLPESVIVALLAGAGLQP
jgi:hypothetical protein